MIIYSFREENWLCTLCARGKKNTLTLHIDFLFLHIVLLPKLQSGELQNALTIVMVICTVLLLVKEITSQQKKCNNRAITHGIHWPYHVLHHLKANGLIEQWNGLFLKCPFEDSVTAPARWQYLVGLGQVLQEAADALNQCLIYGSFSPIARIHGSRN